MWKVLLSAFINFLIASLGAFLAVLTGLKSDAELTSISQVTILVIVVTGLISGAKDAQAYLKNHEPGV